MAHDVFISYATPDKSTADAVCARLEQNGIRCWIAPRDILPSMSWKASIVGAIHASRALVLIFSTHANESTEVPKEVDQAVKKGVSIVVLRIENVPLSSGLDYDLQGRHWLDALNPPLERHIDQLTGTLNALLDKPTTTSQPGTTAVPPAPSTGTGKSKMALVAALAVLAIAAAAAMGWYVASPVRQDRAPDQAKGELRPPPPLTPSGPSAVPAPIGGPSVGAPPGPDPKRPDASPRSGAEGSSGPPRAPASTSAAIAKASNAGTVPAPRATGATAAAPATDPKPDPPPDPTPSVPQSAPAAPVASGSVPPARGSARLLGCWQLPGAPGPIVITNDHTFLAFGIIKGRWDDVDDSVFFMQWPDEVGQAELASDGRRLALTGKVTYTLIRKDASSAILGEWRFADGNPVTVTFTPDGAFQLLAIRGKWRASAGNARVFALIWPGGRVSSVVSADNQSVNLSDPMYGTSGVMKRVACAPAER